MLLLLIAANGAPILLAWALGPRWNWPLDGGQMYPDGHRLLGGHTTLRGLVIAVSATMILAGLLGLGAGLGALIGLLAMVGDALSSFVKRRLGLKPGDKATGLDQIPESLLPLVVVAGHYGLGWLDLALMVATFTLLDMAVSGPLYRLRLRRRPY
ncbi:MAG: CDP-archaeol synthase [Chromatiaceae bacterium]